MSVSKQEAEINVTHAQLGHTMRCSTVPVIGVHHIQRLQKGPSHLRNVVTHFLTLWEIHKILTSPDGCLEKNLIVCSPSPWHVNDPFPVLPGNEQDLGHQTTYTFLFYKACKVHDTVCFGYKSANAEKSWHLSFWHFCQKLLSWMVTVSGKT